MKHMAKIGRRVLAAALTAGMLFSLAGCSFSIPLPGKLKKVVPAASYVFKVGDQRCSEADAKILLLNYQKEYSSLYGIDMWQHDYGDHQSLEDYVKDLAISQLAEVYTLDIIANEQEIVLSEEEEKQVNKAAKEYYSNLSKEEKSYIDGEVEDVASLMERFVLAGKLYQTVTENVDQEVSDDEARVMHLKQVVCFSEENAAKALSELNSGTDIDTVISKHNEGAVTEVTATRTDYDSSVVPSLFSLQNDQYSEILTIDGNYFIFYCVNNFDQDMTEDNKANVLKKRMDDAINSIYGSYASSLESYVNTSVWSQITVDKDLELTGSTFFDVYESYFTNE